MSVFPSCAMCARYKGDVNCEAYPERIPNAIYKQGFDHSKPYPGDNGIRFKQVQFKQTTSPKEG